MPLKVFISYRRQDTAASAIGIGQYLEKEFGRKNVYIDVDMQAGAKYPAVIEKRLAECRVLLVLVGPDWVKLQKPNDWVHREIAYALKREITVIPVLINGAQLPDKQFLPDEIQGLVDHQAATVSLAGFRHEMAGLVKDIRAIGASKPWRLLGGIAAALILSVTAGILGFYNPLDRTRIPASSPELVTNGVWKSRPGEWVMYAIDTSPVAFFLNPSSIKLSGDRVAYTKRFASSSSASASSTKAYQDEIEVIDCKKSVFAQVERTIYNSAGDVVYHFKFNQPESSDLSNGQSVWPGDVVATAQRIMCDEALRTRLLTTVRFGNEHLAYLVNMPDRDGSFFYGPVKPTSNPAYPIEVLALIKRNKDHTFAEFSPGQNVRGLPSNYRNIAGNVQINCKERKVLSFADEYYDKDDHLVYFVAQPPGGRIMDATDGTIFGSLLNVICASSAFNVAGKYDGTNYISYGKNGQAEQQVSVTIQQNESDLKISFQTPEGASGEGTGKLAGNRAESISLHSTTPGCPGSYDGSMSFADNSLSFSYKGKDCGGEMEGHGSAPKVTQ